MHLEFEGIRNNSSGLDEEQMQEVIDEVMAGALRNVSLKLDFSSRKNFPRFTRARNLPDQVMPVGYDSLVREAQTHPPSFIPKIPSSRKPLPKVINKDINKIRLELGIPPIVDCKERQIEEFVSTPNSKKDSNHIYNRHSDKHVPPTSDISFNYKGSFSDDEVIEAGESFSAMSYSPQAISVSLDQSYENSKLYDYYSMQTSNTEGVNHQQLLTPSEESLVARRLEHYDREPSMESIDVSKVLAKYGQDFNSHLATDENSDNDIIYIQNTENTINTKQACLNTHSKTQIVNGLHKHASRSVSKLDDKYPTIAFNHKEKIITGESGIRFPKGEALLIEEVDEDVFLEDDSSNNLGQINADGSTPFCSISGGSSLSCSPRDSIRDEMDLLKESLVASGSQNAFVSQKIQ